MGRAWHVRKKTRRVRSTPFTVCTVRPCGTWRPVRVARTYSTEAPGRTCQHGRRTGRPPCPDPPGPAA
eukprot:scaffold7908_cov63-Phaeocystis_antarctica.AAC.4